MITVVDYIIDQPEPSGTVMGYIHDYITSTYSHLQSTMKYDIPFYIGNHWICYLNPIKKGGVELCFTRGVELSNATGVLESKGRKQISGILITNIEKAPLEAIHATIEEAVLLDQQVPYKHPKNKK